MPIFESQRDAFRALDTCLPTVKVLRFLPIRSFTVSEPWFSAHTFLKQKYPLVHEQI